MCIFQNLGFNYAKFYKDAELPLVIIELHTDLSLAKT